MTPRTYPNQTYWQLLLFGIFTLGLYNLWWLYEMAQALRNHGAKNLLPPVLCLGFPATILLYILLVQTVYRNWPHTAGPLLGGAFILLFISFIVLIVWMRNFARELAWATHFQMSKRLIFWTWVFWGIPTFGVAWSAWLYLSLKQPLKLNMPAEDDD